MHYLLAVITVACSVKYTAFGLHCLLSASRITGNTSSIIIGAYDSHSGYNARQLQTYLPADPSHAAKKRLDGWQVVLRFLYQNSMYMRKSIEGLSYCQTMCGDRGRRRYQHDAIRQC